MTNDEWIKLHEPDFTPGQVEKFKAETGLLYAMDLAILGKAKTDIDRCRKLAVADVKRNMR